MAYRNGKYYNAAYSYEDAKKFLDLYKKALDALVKGQAKEYTIGSRSVTLMDVGEIDRMVNKFSAIVEKYESSSRPARSVAVVYRDT